MSVLIDGEASDASPRVSDDSEAVLDQASWTRLHEAPPAFFSYFKEERVYPRAVQAI